MTTRRPVNIIVVAVVVGCAGTFHHRHLHRHRRCRRRRRQHNTTAPPRSNARQPALHVTTIRPNRARRQLICFVVAPKQS
ncbi:unnamed protein product [Haemonchus placei]|uniref:Secreted protein n=1 Tax=Haemonchus placei TaxID=6290 RepID=A0A0N4WSX2_HAEPC|nr:unnamed protein product [Haemonchus placei]